MRSWLLLWFLGKGILSPASEAVWSTGLPKILGHGASGPVGVNSTAAAHGMLSGPRGLQASHLVFVHEEETAVQSVEEVIYCSIYLTASLPMGLIAEIGLLLQRAVALTLEIREDWVNTLEMTSDAAPEAPEGDTLDLDWQNFHFQFVILPPQRGSLGITYLLQVAAEASLLETLKALVRESPTMTQVLISPFWLLIMPPPEVTSESVTRPQLFATWTSTESPPIYIPAISTSGLPPIPQSCSSTEAPCTCAGIIGCEWVTDSNGNSFCQEGRGRVPCSACSAQEHCAATSCAGLTSPCSCAYSVLGCHWVPNRLRCFDGTSPGTPCSACATQNHCNPPEIRTYFPAAGTQLRVPEHNDIEINFNRAVVIKRVGSVSYKCTGQELPFYVPWEDVRSSSDTGILISISVLLKAEFSSLRTCTLAIGAGVVADRSDVPFTGLPQGLYSFTLGDTVSPQLIQFEPLNGKSDVTPGTAVTFTFNEDLVILAGNNFITVYELTDAGGQVRGGAIAEFRMSSSAVVVSARTITVELAQLTKAGLEYSIDLPVDTISDEAGNRFQGLPSGAYTFRCTGVSFIESPLNDGSLEEFYPVMMAAGAVFVLGPVGLMLWRLSRLRKVKHLQIRPSSISPQTLPPGSPKGLQEDIMDSDELDHSATFASTWSFGNRSEHNVADDHMDSSGRNWAHKVKGPQSPQSPQAQWQGAFVKSSVARKGMAGAGAAAATLNRDRKVGNLGGSGRFGPAPERSDSTKDLNGKSHSKRSSSTNNPAGNSSSAKQTPPKEASHNNQSSQSHSQSNSNQEQSSKPKVDASADMSGDSAALKAKKLAIERKLRDMMQAPVAERKKALRELMLEYHPDKSSDEHAKEVFQFINASRAWFLAET